jgi:hypothetical protein
LDIEIIVLFLRAFQIIDDIVSFADELLHWHGLSINIPMTFFSIFDTNEMAML